MVKVDICLKLLCVVSVFGGRLEELEDRVLTIQTLTFQDLNRLRDSIDRNFGEIQQLTKFINSTMSKVIETSKLVSTPVEDQKDRTRSPKRNGMKSDLIRFKRAFKDHKMSVQTQYSELGDKLEKLRNEMKLYQTDTINEIMEVQEKLNTTANSVTNTINHELINSKKLDNLIDSSGRLSKGFVLQMKEIEDQRKQDTDDLKDDIHNTFSLVSNNSKNVIDLLYRVHKKDIVRLAFRSSNVYSSGFLEVFLNGEWGKVCDNGLNEDTIKVVCRMLGYKNGYFDTKFYFFKQRTVPIHIHSVQCTGNEDSIFDCKIDYGKSDCSRSEDDELPISCYNKI